MWFYPKISRLGERSPNGLLPQNQSLPTKPLVSHSLAFTNLNSTPNSPRMCIFLSLSFDFRILDDLVERAIYFLLSSHVSRYNQPINKLSARSQAVNSNFKSLHKKHPLSALTTKQRFNPKRLHNEPYRAISLLLGVDPFKQIQYSWFVFTSSHFSPYPPHLIPYPNLSRTADLNPTHPPTNSKSHLPSSLTPSSTDGTILL